MIKPGKILIIQTASIGDVILATPVMEALHISFPDANIDFLLKKGNEGLFDQHPFLNELIIWNKKNNKYLNFISVLRYIRKKKYDLIINIQRFFSSGLLTALSGAGTKSGFNKNPLSFTFDIRVRHLITEGLIHEAGRNLELIKKFTGGIPANVKLYPSVDDFRKVKDYKSAKYICIAPASLWFTKQYPAEKWIELIRGSMEKFRIYLLGSENDSEICDRIILGSGTKQAVNLAGKLSFLQTAALMKDAQMNFVNDSAPQHLASAVNAPLTSVFCSTVPEFGFGPLSDDSLVIQTRQDLECRPCGLHGFKSCPEKHFNCAWTINTNELLNRL